MVLFITVFAIAFASVVIGALLCKLADTACARLLGARASSHSIRCTAWRDTHDHPYTYIDKQ